MIEIKTGQTLELDNVLTFRGKLTQVEVQQIGKEMESKILAANAKLVGNPIMATFEIDGMKMDIELICPIDKKIDSIEGYVYKEKIRIVNAVKMFYKGNPNGLQENQVLNYLAVSCLVKVKGEQVILTIADMVGIWLVLVAAEGNARRVI